MASHDGAEGGLGVEMAARRGTLEPGLGGAEVEWNALTQPVRLAEIELRVRVALLGCLLEAAHEGLRSRAPAEVRGALLRGLADALFLLSDVRHGCSASA